MGVASLWFLVSYSIYIYIYMLHGLFGPCGDHCEEKKRVYCMVYLDLVVIIAKKRKCTTVADLQLAQCVDERCRDWLPAVMSKLDADDDWAPPLQQIQSGDWRRVPVAEWTPMAAP
jgi:hypothetical protein